jgi:Prokaryotic E2 family E/Multiubiquitin
MTANPSNAPNRGEHMVAIAGFSLTFHDHHISEGAPTGAQLAAVAGFKPEHPATVLEMLANGELEDRRPGERVDLRESTRKFVIVESDRSYKLTLDGSRVDWPCRVISGGQLRKIGQVSAGREIYQDLPDNAERIIGEQDLADLGASKVEVFKTRKRTWKLNVQGVLLTLNESSIVVRTAIQEAGFDPTKNWIIVLRVRDQPNREVTLDEVIDLRTPGIEKLRLTPKEVNNGEVAVKPRRQFDLLDVDVRFLNGLGLWWETVIDTGRRWLLIHGYPVPNGYTTSRTDLALEVPLTYPGAQIDMFYTYPPLALTTNRPIDRTQVSASIEGKPFNGWSRHRGELSKWNPTTDNVSTHLALVESALAKEVGE